MSHASTYTYQPHPFQQGSFQILCAAHRGDPAPSVAGEYLLLDHSEDYDLTEKTVMNFVTLLNGRDDIMDLSAQSQSRLFYQKLDADHNGRHRVLFRSYRGEGVTTETALLSYDKEKMDV